MINNLKIKRIIKQITINVIIEIRLKERLGLCIKGKTDSPISMHVNKIMTSIILSVIIVPNPFSKGTFSYRVIELALKNSPDRGIPKFERKPTKTDMMEFKKLIL